ncbi:hypothetical protein M9458_050345 [Cirrhinus mrigala]|uniref:Uncharacterized protein n=1 Tax=Cirrhinus mrigala TaxID=683832 RepID=A0ABD0MWK3_CIRMR
MIMMMTMTMRFEQREATETAAARLRDDRPRARLRDDRLLTAACVYLALKQLRVFGQFAGSLYIGTFP